MEFDLDAFTIWQEKRGNDRGKSLSLKQFPDFWRIKFCNLSREMFKDWLFHPFFKRHAPKKGEGRGISIQDFTFKIVDDYRIRRVLNDSPIIKIIYWMYFGGGNFVFGWFHQLVPKCQWVTEKRAEDVLINHFALTLHSIYERLNHAMINICHAIMHSKKYKNYFGKWTKVI